MGRDGTKTILLVEDEALVARVEANILQKYGYKVVMVSSGEQAVEAIEKSNEIDLVLMDINLGKGMDGTQAAEIILAGRDLPLIFLSSHTEREVVEKTEGITSYGYIVKNTGETVLMASIRMAFRLFEARLKEREKEAALLESEERFRLAMEATRDGLWDRDIVSDQVYRSPAYWEMLGYKPDDQPSHTNAWKDLIHPADREATLLANMECIENRRDSFEIELRMRTKAGDWRWIQSRGKAVARDASGRALRLIGTHTDISAHKQVEQALRTSEEHFSKSFRSSPVPTSITSLSDGRVIDANTSMLELLGFNLEEVLGHTTQELHIWVNEEDRAITIQMLRDGKPVRGFETRLRTKSGELRDALISFEVIESGGELRLLSNVFDITERKRVEEALRASQSRMNTIFELVGIALAVTDLQGRWLETNRHFQQVLGYTMDELRNMSYREIVHPDQAEMTMQGMLDLIAGKIDSWQSEILRSCKRISPRFDFLRFETE